jgi:predicted amidohydrolase YtcJ
MKKIGSLFLPAVVSFSYKNEKKSNTSDESTQVTLYYNGDILTIVDDVPSYAEIVVVKDGDIAFVGDASKVAVWEDFNPKKTHSKGKTLLPGFIDGHALFASFSAQAIGAQILPPPDAGAKNIPALIAILKEWNTPKNRALTGWVFGSGFDDSVLE